MKAFENEKYRLEVHQDETPESPREWSNLSVMVCFHRRYNLGDKHDYNYNDYKGWDEMEKAIIRNENVAVILPLYIYEHGGITISTTSFNDRWDSGQIGFIYVTKKEAIGEYGKKIMTKKVKERALKMLEAEVETYDQYLQGDIYGYKLFELEGDNEEEIDSCWGFYGENPLENGMEGHIDSEILNSLKSEIEKEF